jgi:hypothetical protein
MLAVKAWASPSASSQPVRFHLNAQAKRAMARAYARKHHLNRAPRIGHTVAVRGGSVVYALGKVAKAKDQPEKFLGHKHGKKITWADKGASKGKPCRFGGSAVVTMLGYGKVCGITSGGGGTTTGGTTTTTPNPSSPYDIALIKALPATTSGSTCLIAYSVKNVGTATVPSTTTKLTMSANGKTHSATDSVPSLQVGQEYDQSIDLGFDCSSGTYTETVTANSDPQDGVTESSYANNTITQTVTPGATALPDLTVTAITLSADCLTMNAVIKNIGNAAAGASTTHFMASDSNRNQIANAFAPTAALTAGQSETVSATMSSAACTNVNISANADFYQVVTESNEGNNYLAVTVNAG